MFKREIKAIVLANNMSEEDEFKLLDAIFIGIKTDVSEQYLLKDIIKTEEKLRMALKEFSDQVKSDVVLMFFVASDLNLPKSILQALDQKEPIALFIGAGVSKLIDIPLWKELAEEALKYLFEQKYLSYIESDCLRRSASAKSILSILHQSLPKGELKTFYDKVFTPNFEKPNPYDCIAKVDIPIITTTLDDRLWEAMKKNISLQIDEDEGEQVRKNALLRECIEFTEKTPIENRRSLYQIHGSVETLDKHSIITMKSYLENYYGEDTSLKDFLVRLSHEYKIIFLGCGMEEMELIGPIVRSSKRHVVVEGTFIGEKRYFEIQRKYFDGHLKMDIHGYFLDFNGYDRLYTLIEKWMEKVNFEKRRDFNSKLGDIDGVIL